MVTPRRVSRGRQILAQWRRFPTASAAGSNWPRERPSAHRRSPSTSFGPPHHRNGSLRGARIAGAGVPWVADFRDQWSDYLLGRWDPVSRWVIDRVSRSVLSRAFAQTAATEGVCCSLRRATGRSTLCVRNGFDPVERGGGSPFPRRLGYFGCIDPRTQHPDRLWAPLRILRDQGRPWEFEMFVSPGGGGSARVEPPADLTGLVRVKTPVPHPEALNAMQRMTALLVLSWEGRGGETQLPGKLYEYVGTGRPVLVCTPGIRGAEPRRVLRRGDRRLGRRPNRGSTYPSRKLRPGCAGSGEPEPASCG
jgi:hypothetical protein